MKGKKWIAALMAAMLGVSMLAGCGTKEKTKINVAALGNLVPQLHLHHVARFSTDKAWPGPIWGAHPSLPYDESTLQREAAGWRLKLANLAGFTPLETDS